MFSEVVLTYGVTNDQILKVDQTMETVMLEV